MTRTPEPTAPRHRRALLVLAVSCVICARRPAEAAPLPPSERTPAIEDEAPSPAPPGPGAARAAPAVAAETETRPGPRRTAAGPAPLPDLPDRPAAPAAGRAFAGGFAAAGAPARPAFAPAQSDSATGPAGDAAGVEVDVDRGEVRIPARFVNPSRQIEVFACHERGPTHETVLEFDVPGPVLYRALRRIGCRTADDWNATSPSDFLRNQGDRVLVLVRWTRDGTTRELPAEALLVDGESGVASYVRGFSFSAPELSEEDAGEDAEAAGGAEGADDPGESPAAEGTLETGTDGGGPEEPEAGEAAGDAPEADERPRAIPEVVEITLGASRRERAVFSLLRHPTTLRGESGAPGGPPTRALQFWSLPPVVHDGILPDLPELVDQGATATLIFRRLEGEVELLQELRSVAEERGEEDRLPLYDELEPLAREIDRLKARYRQDVEAIRELLDRDRDDYPEEAGSAFEGRAEMLRRRGQWLCARIQELYFTMYELQEKHRIEEMAGVEDVTEDARELVRSLVQNGLRFEVLIAAKERERGRGGLVDLRRAQEILALELEREGRFLEETRSDLERRIGSLDPSDEYLEELLRENLRRVEIDAGSLVWRRRLHELLVRELDLVLEGGVESLEAAGEEIGAERRVALQGLVVARTAGELLEIDESIRWYKNDLESGVPDREETAQEKLEELTARRERVQQELAAARDRLEELRTERSGG